MTHIVLPGLPKWTKSNKTNQKGKDSFSLIFWFLLKNSRGIWFFFPGLDISHLNKSEHWLWGDLHSLILSCAKGRPSEGILGFFVTPAKISPSLLSVHQEISSLISNNGYSFQSFSQEQSSAQTPSVWSEHVMFYQAKQSLHFYHVECPNIMKAHSSKSQKCVNSHRIQAFSSQSLPAELEKVHKEYLL